MNCIACRNVDSKERCPAKALNSLLFCGRHAKSKNVRLWTEVNNVNEKVTTIQKIWRGYLYRKWIQQCGPGCLKRSLCHNEEELVTMDDKHRVYPLDYCSFEEDGKIWWFDIRSAYSILIGNLHPLNPYTRNPIPIEARKRIREICFRRRKFGFELYHENPKPIPKNQLMEMSWIFISQTLEENGFENIHPNILDSMSIEQYYVFLSMFLKDLKALPSEKIKKESRIYRYILLTRRILNNLYTSHDIDVDFVRLFVSIFQNIKNPFPYCYIFASVLYRM